VRRWAYAVLGGRVADRSEDDIETRMMTRASWIPPVKREEDLPSGGVEDGTLCYVEGEGEDEEEVWECRNGRWSQIS
jgi:hypothetical protein